MTEPTPDNMQPLTTGQIAKYCGVNYRTVIRWIERGKLKAYQLPGGRGDNRVEIADFLAFLKAHQMPIPIELATPSRRVLIVDDDPAITKMIQRVLDRAGYETQVAQNGFRAGALLGTFSPNVMTLDLEMPGLGGMEVLEFVRATDKLKLTKVLIISALHESHLQKAIDAGADAALQKPFHNQELIQSVEALL